LKIRVCDVEIIWELQNVIKQEAVQHGRFFWSIGRGKHAPAPWRAQGAGRRRAGPAQRILVSWRGLNAVIA
jgi:hypothetical protein